MHPAVRERLMQCLAPADIGALVSALPVAVRNGPQQPLDPIGVADAVFGRRADDGQPVARQALTPALAERTLCGMTGLEVIGGDVESALERVRVPAYVIDRHGIIRWINPAAKRIVGDVRGRQMTSVLAPEERRRGRELFTRNLIGPPEGSDNRGVFLGASGERITMEVSGVPLKRGDHVIGVFGQVKEVERKQPPPPPHPNLTPRQTEVLHLLEHGHSTDQIADELHLSVETVRNHVRAILRTLGVHSRLEAVALAHQGHVVASVN
jgi:PAS domain S-box-containing protein